MHWTRIRLQVALGGTSIITSAWCDRHSARLNWFSSLTLLRFSVVVSSRAEAHVQVRLTASFELVCVIIFRGYRYFCMPTSVDCRLALPVSTDTKFLRDKAVCFSIAFVLLRPAAAAAADIQMQVPCCVSCLIGVTVAALGSEVPTSVCAALQFRWCLGGPGVCSACQWARAGPVSACAQLQLASRGPALRQGALVRGPKLIGSALGSAKASGQAGSEKQGSQSNITDRQACGPGPTGTAESKSQFASVKVLCKYTHVLHHCFNISATRRARTAQTCTRRAHSRRHDLLSSAHRKHIMHLSMQTITKRA